MKKFFYWFSILCLASILFVSIYHPVSYEVSAQVGLISYSQSIWASIFYAVYPNAFLLVIFLILLTSPSLPRLKILKWVLGIVTSICSIEVLGVMAQIATSSDKAEAAFGYSALVIISLIPLWIGVGVLLILEFVTFSGSNISEVNDWSLLRSTMSWILFIGIVLIFSSAFINIPLSPN